MSCEGLKHPKTELVHVTNASLRLVSWQNVAGEWKTQKRKLVRAANSFLVLGTWNILLGAQTPKKQVSACH